MLDYTVLRVLELRDDSVFQGLIEHLDLLLLWINDRSVWPGQGVPAQDLVGVHPPGFDDRLQLVDL
jgi:hypothetical protein